MYLPERVFIVDSQPEIYKFFTRKYYKEHVSNTKFYQTKNIKLDEYFMEQIASSRQKSGGFASFLFNRIKRVVTGIGAFVDISGYKKEIARYESELKNKNH